MTNLILEGDAIGWYIILLITLPFGIPVLLIILALAIRTKRKKASNIILILTAIYAIVGLGYCGSLMF
ncbi:hypothetical protein [Algibacter pectinivorans]|uniref:Uncharacterized protein n=1 Tax=Algibacter pectinivorans TaxID=870482 RepID=A0A1I1NIB7_9FLAO|nr:hypothetical protein [Algibacter pectinivorans]SFC97012.1 hypothetical protein SAMN04487987_102306 [Algibacter pectinivorans]